jgi:hypothetical protein
VILSLYVARAVVDASVLHHLQKAEPHQFTASKISKNQKTLSNQGFSGFSIFLQH